MSYESTNTIEDAQRAAVAEFPSVAPFADLLIGNTAEAIREAARDVAQRLASGGNAEVVDDVVAEPSITDWSGFAPVAGDALKPDYIAANDDPNLTQDQKFARFWNAQAEAE